MDGVQRPEAVSAHKVALSHLTHRDMGNVSVAAGNITDHVTTTFRSS